jgi:hypothetical protein
MMSGSRVGFADHRTRLWAGISAVALAAIPHSAQAWAYDAAGGAATGANSTAVGARTRATGTAGGTAIVADSITQRLSSSALGRAANSAGSASVAVGFGAGATVAGTTSVGAIAVGVDTRDPAVRGTVNLGIGGSTL